MTELGREHKEGKIEISCDVDDCVNNTDGTCGEPDSISVSNMISCIEMSCAYDISEEEIHCLNSGLPISECLCEGECKVEED